MLSILLFVCLVQAVFLEDAFTKNWIKHNHGSIIDYELLSPTKLVGLTDTQELLSYDFDLAKNSSILSWKHTIPSLQGFVVGDDLTLTYTSDKSSLWSSNGGLVTTLNFQARSTEKALDGFVILGSKVYFVNSNGTSELPIEAKDIKVSEFNDELYVITDTLQLLKFDKEHILKSTTDLKSFKFRDIKQFKYNKVSTGNKIIDVDQDEVVVTSKSVELLNSKLSFSFTNNELKIFDNKGKEVSRNSYDDIVDHTILNEQIVLRSKTEHLLLDVSKFTETFDESSINLENFEATYTPNTKEYFFGNEFVIVELSDSNFKVVNYHYNVDVVSTHTVPYYTFKLDSYNSLLIDKPESELTMDSIKHLVEEAEISNPVLRWYRRLRRHLSEIGKFALSKFINVHSEQIHLDNQFGLEKLLVINNNNKLTAFDSFDGRIVWEYDVESSITDLFYSEGKILVVYEKRVAELSTRDGTVITTYSIPVDSIYEDGFHTAEDVKGIILKQIQDSTLQTYKSINGKLVPYWSFKPEGSIIAYDSQPHSKTSSVGIQRADKSILYKYLNSNLVTVIANSDAGLKLYLLDGVTGRVLISLGHTSGETVDLNSVRLLSDDNWIIYSYFVTSPKYEQRVLVIDLFSHKENLHELDTHSIKTFIYPDRIVDLTSTFTKSGITTKSILVLTEFGSLIEVPKYILNSRRIDDKVLTQNDFQDDFRMTPYEPVISKNLYQVLNHQHQLEVDDKNSILVKETKLESTAIVCLVNSKNIFCSSIQPSLSFDILNENFDKIKLLLIVLVLVVGYLVTNPMVLNKRLNSQWIYQI